MTPGIAKSLNGPTTTSDTSDTRVYTVIVELHDGEASVSVHRQDGSLIGAVAGDSTAEALLRAAKLLDKEGAK